MASASRGLDLDATPWLRRVDDRRKRTGDRRAEPRYAPLDGAVEPVVVHGRRGDALQADLLDLSAVSVRLALHPGARLALGDWIRIGWRPPAGEEWRLEGAVVRIEAHSLITVVVVALQQAASQAQPAPRQDPLPRD